MAPFEYANGKFSKLSQVLISPQNDLFSLNDISKLKKYLERKLLNHIWCFLNNSRFIWGYFNLNLKSAFQRLFTLGECRPLLTQLVHLLLAKIDSVKSINLLAGIDEFQTNTRK